MSLATYKQKRNFKESPEPTGGKSSDEQLRFVIQKHDATNLHYDFRLEMEGVLKSWAVPKGPSTDPDVKRLAMMVEDHPYDYRSFEGIIPSGYGAGTVIVWDEGFYEPAEDAAKTKKENDKQLLKQLKEGKLKITLKGSKLKGEFALVKAHGRGENGWLLFKIKDKYAATSDVLKKDKSVISKKTLKQVEKTTDNFYGSDRVKESGTKSAKEKELNKRADVKAAAKKNATAGKKAASAKTKPGAAGKTAKKAAPKKTPAKSKKSSPAKKAAPKKSAGKSQKSSETEHAKEVLAAAKDPSQQPAKKKNNATSTNSLLKDLPEKKLPKSYTPMLATLVDKPFDEEGWLYEVKWDGYRALAVVNDGKVELKSRNNKSFNEKFYPITAALEQWKGNAILDGEVVVVGENGISDFGALQNWRSEADGILYYYIFDVLWLEGKDLTGLTLTERRQILDTLEFENELLRISDAFDESGLKFFETAAKMGLEGIIAKKAESQYHPGARSKEWLKIKANKRQEMVIGGYTINDNTSKAFSSLLVGVYEGKKLVYTGKVGTGFNAATQKEMMEVFKKLEVKKPPFESAPDVNKPSRFRRNPPNATVTWLKPSLVCEVSFTEMTSDGVMRHPSFEGMREDKKPKEVTREKASPTKETVQEADESAATSIVRPAGKRGRKTLLNPKDETQVRKVKGHELKFTNLSKLYWKKEKITKRDMLNYYYQVAPFILPYLKGRPQSMNRHPDGIDGKSFYFKDVTGKAPGWVETYKYKSDADNRVRNYLVAESEADLLYMASLGCIEMNPWSSLAKKEDYPTWCIIDLDPGKKTSFEQVIETANVTREVLEKLGVQSYPKTSGSTGIHIYIPLGEKYTYEHSKEFARVVARLVHRELPDITSIERAVKARKGKMYIDFLQNRPQATVSAPYSLRPKPGATVSMPLHWEEVKPGLQMSDFHISNALERIESEGDLFKPVLGKGIDLEKVITSYSELETSEAE